MMQSQQGAKLVVKNVCPDCGSTACAQFMSVDGSEVHINCVDCNKVFAGRIIRSGDLHVRKWREIGTFARL